MVTVSVDPVEVESQLSSGVLTCPVDGHGILPVGGHERLGHTQVATTLSIYAHVRPGDDRDAATLAVKAILGPKRRQR